MNEVSCIHDFDFVLRLRLFPCDQLRGNGNAITSFIQPRNNMKNLHLKTSFQLFPRNLFVSKYDFA